MKSALLMLLMLSALTACGQPAGTPTGGRPQANTQSRGPRPEQRWADSVYNALSTDERIGQLFMVAAYSGGPNANEPAILELIRKRQIGGIIFMQGGPVRQALLTNKYQKLAQVPLLIGMDAEWGLGMRLDSVRNLPRAMQLGATRDTGLAHLIGSTIAYQCQRLGVHINFGPVVDVNNNPANPIINARSFGEDKHLVTNMGLAYMHGQQEGGVMACAKHFPGHGDVSVDSHKDLPLIRKTRTQLDTLELFPFKALIKGGVQSIMVAHLSVAALDSRPNVPTTLSQKTITGLLRRELGFHGLIFTDAMNMQGVTKYFPAGEADYQAFLAGNDVLLFSQDVPTAIRKIRAGLNSGAIEAADLEHRVKKILAAKYLAGLSKPINISTANLAAELNRYTDTLCQQVADKALTLVRGSIPVVSGKRVAYVAINGGLNTESEAMLKRLLPGVEYIRISKNDAGALSRFSSYDAVVVGVHGLSFYPGKSYGLDAQDLALVAKAATMPNSTIALMGNAYAIRYLCNAKNILVAYEDNIYTQQAAIKAIAGRLQPQGRLPVTPPCLK